MFKSLKDMTAFKLMALAITGVAVIYIAQMLYRIFSLFTDIFLIFILAWLISFIFDPLIAKVERLGIRRLSAALIVYLFFSLGLIILLVMAIPIMVEQINLLIQVLPSYLDHVPDWANRVADFFLSALNNSLTLVQKIASAVFYIVIVLMLSFYLVLDKNKMWHGLMLFIPRNYRDEAEFVKVAIDTSFAGFLRAQVIFGLISGAFTLVFLLFTAPSFALLVGILSGFLTILPLVGPVLAIIPPFAVLLPYGPAQAFWLTLIIFIFQQIELNVLGPKIFGKTMKLHPIWVLVAFLLGLKFAGIWGSIFALPIASVVGVITAEVLPHFIKASSNRTE